MFDGRSDGRPCGSVWTFLITRSSETAEAGKLSGGKWALLWGCEEEQKSHQDAGQFLVVLWVPPMSPGAGKIARPEELSLPQSESCCSCPKCLDSGS